MRGTYPTADFARLADIIAPGRSDVLAVIEAYFDESYDDTLLCVAGYVFVKSKAKALDAEWKKMLRAAGLPYFRMSACAHRTEPFDRLTREQCDQVARHAIGLIRKYAACGFATTLDEKAFEARVPANVQAWFGGAYEFCVWNCLMGVRRWMLEESNRKKARVAYVFEAGHKHQLRASALMSWLVSDTEVKDEYFHESHAFVGKVGSRPTQAADLFAWQWYTNSKRQLQGKPMRRDCSALMQDRLYLTRNIDLDKHMQVIEQMMRDDPLPNQAWRRA